MAITNSSKFIRIFNALKKELGPVFSQTQLQSSFNKVTDGKLVGEQLKKKLFSRAQKLEINWEDKSHTNLYTFKKDNIEIEYLLSAWTTGKSKYVSHYSAMYLHELVLQRPHDFHISDEILTSASPMNNLLSSAAVKQSFMKTARKTNQKGYYKGNTFIFHEKKKAHLCGIIVKEFRGVPIKISDNERTFIDSIMSIDSAGGISTIVSAFKETELDPLKLINYYRLINPIYPYWQRMGMILTMINSQYAIKIKNHFGSPQMDFYLDNNYRDDWAFNSEWRIFYPRGFEGMS